MSDGNKPWMTTRILELLDQKRKDYNCGRMVQWRKQYFKIKVEMKKVKKESDRLMFKNCLNQNDTKVM